MNLLTWQSFAPPHYSPNNPVLCNECIPHYNFSKWYIPLNGKDGMRVNSTIMNTGDINKRMQIITIPHPKNGIYTCIIESSEKMQQSPYSFEFTYNQEDSHEHNISTIECIREEFFCNEVT